MKFFPGPLCFPLLFLRPISRRLAFTYLQYFVAPGFESAPPVHQAECEWTWAEFFSSVRLLVRSRRSSVSCRCITSCVSRR
ncbi:hypothetical protein J3F83DRAFT_734798 [Trichoderma novae-zelandiae]